MQLIVNHRLGPNQPNDRARPIIAKFMSLNQRDKVWAARFKIKKDDGIKVRVFFNGNRTNKEISLPLAKRKPQVNKCGLVRYKLVINGT